MILYNIGIFLYWLGILVASLFNEKARLFIRGRRNVFENLRRAVGDVGEWVWFHVASLGEFEQSRPIIEKLKKERPEKKVLLTFFSPSGYEVRKDYDKADFVCYLPMDSFFNARRFVRIVRPQCAIFIKYEFWPCYLTQLKYNNIDTYAVSAIFRESQAFFKWYGALYARVLRVFRKLYVQDANSANLLKTVGITNVAIAGDTRFDRVVEIAKGCNDLPLVEAFKGGERVLIAGSSWEPDEEMLIEYFNTHEGFKMILAPHVTSEAHVEQICERLGKKYVRYTKTTAEEAKDAECLVIDCIGILTSVYKYGDVGYVGGGFGVGIHNTLEPAVFGMPIFFGPNYKKFREAVEMVKAGVAFPVSGKEELFPLLDDMFYKDAGMMERISDGTKRFVRDNCGATEMVVGEVFG